MLGYDETIRGFEPYVIDGNFGWKANVAIRYHLVNQPKLNLRFIPFDNYKFLPLNIYLEAYTDGGYVDYERPDASNLLLSTFLYSGGIGVNALFYNDRILRFRV